MKKVLLVLALAAGISFGASAQTREDGNKGGQRSKPFKELNLTPEQQKEMKALSEDFKTKSNALRAQQRDLMKSHQADIKAILTPEQQTKWQEMIDKRSKEGHQFADRARGGKQMQFDAATKSKLDDLRSDFRKEKKTIQASGISDEAQQQKIQDLRDKFRSERRAIIKEARQKKDGNNAA